MRGMKQSPVVFFLNASVSSGCDYATQTMRIVARSNPVYGICLGDVVSLFQFFLDKEKWIVRSTHGVILIRPVSLIPGLRFRIVRQLTYMMVAALVRIFVDLKYPSTRKFLWYFEPFHISLLRSMFWNYDSIYDCVDYFPGFHDSAKKEHAILARRSTYLFANSLPLARDLRRIRPDVTLVPLGFARDLFRKVRVSKVTPNKRAWTVGYIGSISARMDFALLSEVVRQLPDVSFVFVGQMERNVFGSKDDTEQSFRALRQNANVSWVPGIKKTDVPLFISRFDIGCVPYRTSLAFNRYAFPMKVLEYFALGRPVISTRILSFHDYVRDGLVTQSVTAAEFVRAIRRIRRLGWSRYDQHRQVREARRNSWERKISVIMQILSKRTNV